MLKLRAQAAEKAAAQSDREINGYRIESISITHDRQEHYQRQSMGPQVCSSCELHLFERAIYRRGNCCLGGVNFGSVSLQ